MKCYNHNDNDAVGVCKSCLKGICTECATDIGGGLACSDECAQTARDSIDLVKRTVESQKDFRKGGALIGPMFFLFMGLGFIGFSLYKKGFGEFGYLFGGLFVFFGLIFFMYNRRYMKR